MPKVDTTPKQLKPYLFHGLDLSWKEGEPQATGDCPWCGREGKFSVNLETGQWKCWVCQEGNDNGGGNAVVFLRMLHLRSFEATKPGDYSALAEERRLLEDETPLLWGLAKSSTTGDWLVPGYKVDGKLSQVYRYSQVGDRMLLMPTPTFGHHLLGIDLCQPDRETVYICEGPWDGMALWETMGRAKQTDRGLVATSNRNVSLLHSANVIAVPSCTTFDEAWLPLFKGKRVCLMYDNDHPREHPTTGKPVAPAAYSNTKRVAGILLAAPEPPASVSYLSWGPEGYDLDLPSGFDVRDFLASDGQELPVRLSRLSQLLEKVRPVPADWTEKAKRKPTKSEGPDELECLPCRSYKTLTTSWRKAMRWTEGLDRALSVMLASVCSTKSVGDQLWVKIVGPASCGKSTLCEAVSVSKKYVLAKSTIRGFHSGYKTDKSGEEDNSLIVLASGKTLVVKDGDTILQLPNRDQVLSEARDLYDCTSRAHYRHGLNREYLGVRMTWILCGTSALRFMDSSELGQRFLDCVIMEEIEDELEDEIALRVAYRAEQSLSIESDGSADTHNSPEMTRVMQLTGGYVEYLRENAIELLSSVEMDDAALRRCTHLAKFVSFMRARPSLKQDESAEREFSSRLVSQHVRLAKCLAVVLNRKTVDAEVMRRVRSVALDTARGQTLEIAKCLYLAGEEGSEVRAIALASNHTEDKTRTIMRFLRRIKAAESVQLKTKGIGSSVRWRLTSRVRRLYSEVLGDEQRTVAD